MILFAGVIILGLLQSVAQLDINFLCLFAVFAGLKKGPVWGLVAGIFIGCFAEILSSSVFGLNLALYSAIGLMAGMIRQKIYYKEGAIMDFLFSFFGMMVFYLAYFAFAKTTHVGALITIVFSSLISPLLFKIIE